jgi:hypothetical protein
MDPPEGRFGRGRLRFGASATGLRWAGPGWSGRLTFLFGLLLSVSAFTGWYTGEGQGVTISVLGWNTGVLGKLVFFVGVAVLAFLALRASGVELPPSVPGGMVIAGLGLVGTIFVLVRVISIPDDFSPAGRSIGLWISLLAGLLLIAAGLLRSAEEV